jgi:MoaA/NifB/PqqE/SkfB family radical SAM enzyme
VRRLALLAARALRSHFGTNPAPFKLTLICTWACDCRCRMCNIWSREKERPFSVDEVRAFLRRNPGLSWINLSGGEIFTRPDAVELVAAVAEEARDLYLLDFPTTGQNTERIVAGVRAALAAGVPRLLVTVSLDGAGEEHDEVRRIKGAWVRALATFRALRGIRRPGFGVFLGVTLSPFNRGALLRIVEAVRAEIPGVTERDFHVNLAQESAHYYGNTGMGLADPSVLADMEEFLRRRGTGLHPVALLERMYQKRLRGFVETGRSPVPCRALRSSVYVSPTFEVYPCTMWDAPLGNLRDHDLALAPIWTSALAEERRTDVDAGRCPHCWTPCEAYPSLLAQVLKPSSPMPRPAAAATRPAPAAPAAEAPAGKASPGAPGSPSDGGFEV